MRKNYSGEPYHIVGIEYIKKRRKVRVSYFLKNNLVEDDDQSQHYHFLALILTNRLDSLTKIPKIRENLWKIQTEEKISIKVYFGVIELDGNIYSKVTGELRKCHGELEQYLNKEIISQALMKELPYSKNIFRWLLYFL